jgi:hypothetical protein
MLTTILRRIALTALIACAPLAAGCYAEADYPEASDGYQPVVHDNGSVVYYDTAGSPYYYEGNRVVYVTQSSPYYTHYVSHYRTYRPYYNRWYSTRGYRYRTTRYNYRTRR